MVFCRVVAGNIVIQLPFQIGQQTARADTEQIWHQPFMTVNGHHIISDIIDICGGINVFASAASLTPVISAENLLEADPQAVISSLSLEFAETGIRERLSTISAVRNNHLFFVHPDLLHRQTPRILQAAQKVCAQLEAVRSG